MDNIAKARNDERLYRHIELANGLCATLVSDPRSRSVSKEAGVALSVGVGSFSDPQEMQGLAHFLEHMVFMGNKKYKQENELDVFLQENGGYSNAYTECEHTMFYLTILPEKLDAALDHFASIFIEPLFSPSCFHREINAVDSEFQGALHCDHERGQQIFASQCRVGHPYRNFLWGNGKSLTQSGSHRAEELLRSFFEAHYSSDIMNLTIVSCHSLDDLEAMARLHFSPIKNRCLKKIRENITALTITADGDVQNNDSMLSLPFEPADPKHFTVTHIKSSNQESNTLRLIFQLPPLLHLYSCMPLDYISSLLGHESEGSVLEELKKRNWATHLSVGCANDGYSKSKFSYLFEVTIILTTHGKNYFEDIIELVLAYIEIVRQMGPQKWYHDELKRLNSLEFENASEIEVDEYAISICEAMNLGVKVEDLLTSGHVYLQSPIEWCPQLEMLLLSYLQPQNMKVLLLTSEFHYTDQEKKVEPWFSSEYFIMTIKEEVVMQWANVKVEDFSFLHMPPKNIFIPSNLSLLPADDDDLIPKMMVEKPLYRCWYSSYNPFKQPKAKVCLYFWLPHALNAFGKVYSPIYLEIYLEMLRMILTPVAYFAEVAGLYFQVQGRGGGIELSFSGFNHKMTELADKVASAMRRLADCEQMDKDLFNVVLETLRRKYMNATIKPEKQCNAARLCLLFPHRSHPRDAAQALKMVSLSGLEMYMRTMFKVAFVDSLICGNMSSEESMRFLNVVVSKLRLSESIPMTKAMEPSFRVVDLATAKSPEKVDQLSSFLYEEESDNPNETNTAIDVYFQMNFCESTYDEEVVYCQIINYLISEKFFDILRTKEQLGYDVSCDDLHSIGVVGFHFCIKSPSASGAFLEERIECFIERIAQYLSLLPEKHFKRSSESLAKLRLLPPENLYEQTSRFWRQIIDRRYEWNVRQREAIAIRSAKLSNVVEWFCRNFLKQRKKMTILVHSNSNLDHENDSEDMDRYNTESNESGDSEGIDSDEDLHEGSACVDTSEDIPVPGIGIFGNPNWWKEHEVKKIKSNDFSAFANGMPLHRTFTT